MSNIKAAYAMYCHFSGRRRDKDQYIIIILGVKEKEEKSGDFILQKGVNCGIMR